MNYVIRNNKGVYIKIDAGGRPVSCNFKDRTLMDKNKARNVINSLPKSLKKLKFFMEAIPDIPPKVIKNDEPKELSENITRWVDKFGACGDVFNAAIERSNELISQLYDLDRTLLNILHTAEIEKSKDLYTGWLVYKAIRENRLIRRETKDEILIIQTILTNIKPECFQRERIQKAVDGLFHRKYTYRIIEGNEDDESETEIHNN